MNFSYPFFLYLLPLTIVPIIIHLIFNIIRRQKPFPNIFILKIIKEEERGLKKISDLILIILRILIILLIILLLSKPYISFEKMPSLMIIDVSASMKPFKEKIEKILNEYPNIKKLYISDKVYEKMPNQMLSTLNYGVFKKLNLDNSIVISDFQKSNFLSLENYRKYKIGEVSKNRAIIDVKRISDTLIVKTKLNGNLEIYENENLIYIKPIFDTITKITNLNVKTGFLKLKLLPLDSLDYDNYYYVFFEPSKTIKARIFADKTNYKILFLFLNSIFKAEEGDDFIFIAQKNFPIKSVLNKNSKVIVFFDNFDVPFEIKRNYIFNGVVIDSVMLYFSRDVVYKKDNLILIGIDIKELLLNPKLVIWFENFLNNLVGNYKIYYSSPSERINFDKPIRIRAPDGTTFQTNSILINDVGFYFSDEEKIVICSNVDRRESLNDYYEIQSYNLPKVRDISNLLAILLLIIVFVEIVYLRRH
mgnify:CR=1 FL=1